LLAVANAATDKTFTGFFDRPSDIHSPDVTSALAATSKEQIIAKAKAVWRRYCEPGPGLSFEG